MRKGIVILFLLLLSVLFTTQNNLIVSADQLENQETNDEWYDASKFRENSYLRVYHKWLEDYEEVNLNQEIITPSNRFESQNPDITFVVKENGKVAVLDQDDTLTLEMNVPETGLYEIGIDYYTVSEFSAKPTVTLKINDKTQFNEMINLPLDVLWKIEPRVEADRYNRYGNELLPYSTPVVKWYKQYFKDSTRRFDEPFKFLLTEGLNTISITAGSEALLIGNIYLNQSSDLLPYQDYNETGLTSNSQGEMIEIQGEDFSYKNDLEIKSSYYKDPAMTPYNYKNTVLNRLDGGSMSRGGSSVTYEFEVVETGYYKISFKALKNTLSGLSSNKRIYIDGEILFKELNEYLFEYDRKWKNITLGNEETPFEFYFTKGKHTITIESSLSHVSSQIDRLYTIMDEVNSIGLAVKTITGGSQNEFIDWDILKYLPSVSQELETYSEQLNAIYDEINQLNSTQETAPEISSILVASDQLARLAKNPNKLSSKLSELTEGSGSAYQLIGNAIATLTNQPLDIDVIYIHNIDKLPKTSVNFFVKAYDAIRSFIYSFFDERYKLKSNQDDEVLEVWMGKSNLYLDVVQSMIDDGFTKETGIEVKVNILPSTQKIILSNATGSNPDVVLSIDSWEPYNYALRGMLTDLSKFDDFDEVVQNYKPNNFTPMIYEDGVYGIPETQSFYFLFYRKDILNFLGVEAPNTWEDALKILPILQSYQMNFYHPLGGEGAYKGYGLTSPIIYQFGGEIYTENGLSTVLNDEKTINSIKFMTDLFTIYNLPLQVPNFFEHFRSGSLPIGIHTSDLYLTLKYAAPELAGQWGMLPIPGNDLNEDGIVERWAPTYGQASIIFDNSQLKDEAWKLVKWWNQTQTQVEYLQNIKMNLGERFMSIPANLEALENSVWDKEVIEVGLQQAQWARIPAVTPGSYIVERELTNIFNKIVLEQVNTRVAIDESIPRINRELARKFEEFEYLENGEVVKEYVVPNHSNIELWIPKKD